MGDERTAKSGLIDHVGLPARHRFTVDEFHRMGETGVLTHEDRVELIDGEIIEMTPIGSRHAGTVTRLNNLLVRAFGDRALLSPQNPVILNDTSEPQPDLALLRPKPSSYTDAHPAPQDVYLVIEVSESSLHYDRDIKLRLYAITGIREVWIVDLIGQTVEVCRGPGPRGYATRRVCRGEDALAVEALGGWSCRVSDVLITL